MNMYRLTKIMYNHFEDKYEKKKKFRLKKRWNKKLFHWRGKKDVLTSKKPKKLSTALNDIEQLFILVSAVTEFVYAFTSLIGVPIGILSSACSRIKNWCNNFGNLKI